MRSMVEGFFSPFRKTPAPPAQSNPKSSPAKAGAISTIRSSNPPGTFYDMKPDRTDPRF